jgi:hypothetical protein
MGMAVRYSTVTWAFFFFLLFSSAFDMLFLCKMQKKEEESQASGMGLRICTVAPRSTVYFPYKSHVQTAYQMP